MAAAAVARTIATTEGVVVTGAAMVETEVAAAVTKTAAIPLGMNAATRRAV